MEFLCNFFCAIPPCNCNSFAAVLLKASVSKNTDLVPFGIIATIVWKILDSANVLFSYLEFKCRWCHKDFIPIFICSFTTAQNFLLYYRSATFLPYCRVILEEKISCKLQHSWEENVLIFHKLIGPGFLMWFNWCAMYHIDQAKNLDRFWCTSPKKGLWPLSMSLKIHSQPEKWQNLEKWRQDFSWVKSRKNRGRILLNISPSLSPSCCLNIVSFVHLAHVIEFLSFKVGYFFNYLVCTYFCTYLSKELNIIKV